MSLKHKTIYSNENDIVVNLPLTPSLQEYHENGSFPLLDDPKTLQKAVIVGMFVLRPGTNKPMLPPKDPSNDKDALFSTIYDEKLNWIYNLDGLDGGWVIANLNSVDAYRLGMQYGLSDAVMVGSHTVCAEGITKSEEEGGKLGYVWQPYGPFEWPSVKNHDKEILSKVDENRKLWQEMGYLSTRRYPAQIIITNSGRHFSHCPDFLEARIFSSFHPTGEPIECYIVTTEIGAQRICDRAKAFPYFTEERLKEILIVLPSQDEDHPEVLDLSSLPSLLYSKYDMKIINHDGGQKILRDFSKAGILTQMNLTLGMNHTLREVVESLPSFLISEEKREKTLEAFHERIHCFFSFRKNEEENEQEEGVEGQEEEVVVSSPITPMSGKSSATNLVDLDDDMIRKRKRNRKNFFRGISRKLPLSYCIEDENKDVLICTFNTKNGFDFYEQD
jgi:hypothetical protein